jgi:hypothetical protein
MKLGRSHQLKLVPQCVDCGKQLDGAAGVDTDDAPDPGDFTVCAYCGSIMVYNDGLTLRQPDAAEAREIASDKRILAIQRARKAVGNLDE